LKNEPHGGGYIWIHSYQLILDGATLSANGNSDSIENDGGGGAGGSIFIAVTSIKGSGNIRIEANGADAVKNGGAGSGGRIKFYYFQWFDSSSYTNKK